MPNFDFHSNLSSYEFECLIRDVLEIRESPLKFRTFKPGKDGGLDLKCTNSKEKIIGQVKLYKHNSPQLKSNLIEELIKAKKQKAARYILVISVALSPKETTEILTLFEGYIISENDIIDKEQLNKYLGQPEYKSILKTYSKLLVPDMNLLEIILDQIINRDIQNRTRRELLKIEQNRKFFVQPAIFNEALDQLEKNKIIMISGNPGVGKTTLAHMLINYMVFSAADKTDFLYCKSLDEIDKTFQLDRRQIFLWDDFWGQKFNEAPDSASYFDQFVKMLMDITTSDKHFLIITSREYIIKEVLLKNNKELNIRLNLNKLMLKVDAYNEQDRLRIFLNHLYFSEFEKVYFDILIGSERDLEYIIHHRNYSPRHIEYFIKYIYKNEFEPSYHNEYYKEYDLLPSFIDYLNNPHGFWEDVFRNQSDTALLILITLLISSDPLYKQDLAASFRSYQALARSVLNLKIDPLRFDEELYKLEELFLLTEVSADEKEINIYFQSPGIKDFLLEYIRKNIDSYAEVLIPGAIFFNQLNFVFTTKVKREEIEDLDNDNSLFGQKIILNQQAKTLLKLKVLSSFDQLIYSVDRGGRRYTNKFDRFDNAEESKYWRLLQLGQWFPFHLFENEEIKQFVLREVLDDMDRYKHAGNTRYSILVSSKCMDEFPKVIGLCEPFFEFNKAEVLESFYANIRSTKDFLAFHSFKDVFPETFTHMMKSHSIEIGENIRKQILIDIKYYNEDEYLNEELEPLLDYYMYEVFKRFGLEFTREFERQIEFASGGAISYREAENSADIQEEKAVAYTRRQRRNIDELRKDYRPPKFKAVINEVAGLDDDIEFKPIPFLKEIFKNDKVNYKQAIGLMNSNDPLLIHYFNNSESIFLLSQYLPATAIQVVSLHQKILMDIIQQVGVTLKIDAYDQLMWFFNELAFEIYFSETKTTTSRNIQGIFSKSFPSVKLNDLSVLYPILIKRGNWYEFLNIGLLYSYCAQRVSNENNDALYLEILERLIENCIYDDDSLIRLIEINNPSRFKGVFLTPNLGRFLAAVSGHSDREIFTNYLEFFDLQNKFIIDREMNKLEDSDSGNSEMIVEFILLYLLRDRSNVIHFDVFFCADFYTDENIKDHGLHENQLARLYEQVITTCNPIVKKWPKQEGYYEYVDLDYLDFVRNDANYEALKAVGMVDYVLKIYNLVKERFSKL